MKKIFRNKLLAFYPFMILSLTQFLYNFSAADVEVKYIFQKNGSNGTGGLSDNNMFWIRLSDRIEGFLLIFISLNSDLETNNNSGHTFNVSFSDDAFGDAEAEDKIYKSKIGTLRAYFIGKDPVAVNLDPLNDKLTEGTLSGILNEIAVYDKLTSRTYLSKREYDLVVMHALDQNIWDLFVDETSLESAPIKNTNTNSILSYGNNEKDTFNGGFDIISFNKPNIISNNFKIILPFTASRGTFSDETTGTAKKLFKYEVNIDIAENAVYKFVHFNKKFVRTESEMNKIDGAVATKIEEELRKILGEV